MTTLQEILAEDLSFSSLSVDASFNLEDILLEPADDMQLDDFDDELFDDQEEEGKGKEGERQKQLKTNNDQPKEQLVKICRERRLKDIPLPSCDNMTIQILKNVTNLFEDSSTIVGSATCLCSTGNKYLAVGTSTGCIALFQVGEKKPKILSTPYTPQKWKQVTTLSISQDNKYLAVGYETGVIAIWDLPSTSMVKQQRYHNCKILKVLFASCNQFLVNDLEGNMALYTISKYWMAVDLKRKAFFQTTQAMYFDFKAHNMEGNTGNTYTNINTNMNTYTNTKCIVVFCTLDEVMVIQVKPVVKPMHKIRRPEGIPQSKIPNIQPGRVELPNVIPKGGGKVYGNVLCISWAKTVYVYRFVDNHTDVEDLVLLYTFSQQTTIYCLTFITEGVLTILDDHQILRCYVLSLVGATLINASQLPSEPSYQRFMRDKGNKYLRSFNNTLINCSFSPQKKELFVICKDSISRCRLHKWKDYISDLVVEHGQYIRALRLSIELWNGRLNIFADKPGVGQNTKKFFLEVGRIYLVEKMKMIISQNQLRVYNIDQLHNTKLIKDQLEETYDILIEYMLELGVDGLRFLFDTVYSKTLKEKTPSDDYLQAFISCLQPFIVRGLIDSIPSLPNFRTVTSYFISKGKLTVVQQLLMSLRKEYIYYSDSVQICSGNKLYAAMCYICAVHQDYISPANKLMNAIIQAQSQGMQNAQRIYYQILRKYLTSLLQNTYINGRQITVEHRQSMRNSISTWLTCSQCLQFFTNSNTSMNTNTINTSTSTNAYNRDYFMYIEMLIGGFIDDPLAHPQIHRILTQLRENNTSGECKGVIVKILLSICGKVKLQQMEIAAIMEQGEGVGVENQQGVGWMDFLRVYHQSFSKYPGGGRIITKSAQLSYLNYLILSISGSTPIKPSLPNCSTARLTSYIFQHYPPAQLVPFTEDLLKIHSESTLIYLLEKYSIQQVDGRVMTIKDEEYRYYTLRKLLKKIRNDHKIKKKKKTREGSQSQNKDSQTDSQRQRYSQNQRHSQRSSRVEIEQQPVRKRFSTEVMLFYIECLCKYKPQKRIYYEFQNNFEEYSTEPLLSGAIGIISKYQLPSCLGILLLAKKNYLQSYAAFEKVYVDFFFKENYDKLLVVQPCHGRFMRKMFQKMKSICEQIDTEEYWLKLLGCVIKPLQQPSKKRKMDWLVIDDIQDVYEKKNQKKSLHPFLVQLSQILQQCLTKVSKKIPISNISSLIQLHSNLFNKTFMLKSFASTLSTYSKDAASYSLTNGMICGDQITAFQNICQQHIKGVSLGRNCQKCKQLVVLQGKAFKCGHIYHNDCLRLEEGGQYECQECISIDSREKLQPEPVVIRPVSEQNLLVRGIRGIFNVIPSMLNALPIGSSRQIQPQPRVMEEVVASQDEIRNAVNKYLAFDEYLLIREEQFNDFTQEYQKYLQKYI